jgi:class 3 adenylate cyclase
MKEALARHERIVSDAIAKRGGYVFKTVGDAFCAASSRHSMQSMPLLTAG